MGNVKVLFRRRTEVVASSVQASVCSWRLAVLASVCHVRCKREEAMGFSSSASASLFIRVSYQGAGPARCERVGHRKFAAPSDESAAESAAEIPIADRHLHALRSKRSCGTLYSISRAPSRRRDAPETRLFPWPLWRLPWSDPRRARTRHPTPGRVVPKLYPPLVLPNGLLANSKRQRASQVRFRLVHLVSQPLQCSDQPGAQFRVNRASPQSCDGFVQTTRRLVLESLGIRQIAAEDRDPVSCRSIASMRVRYETRMKCPALSSENSCVRPSLSFHCRSRSSRSSPLPDSGKPPWGALAVLRASRAEPNRARVLFLQLLSSHQRTRKRKRTPGSGRSREPPPSVCAPQRRATHKILIDMARPEGFEPPTLAFEARCSIQLSYGRAGGAIVYQIAPGAAPRVVQIS